jgi:hypothetical protein
MDILLGNRDSNRLDKMSQHQECAQASRGSTFYVFINLSRTNVEPQISLKDPTRESCQFACIDQQYWQAICVMVQFDDFPRTLYNPNLNPQDDVRGYQPISVLSGRKHTTCTRDLRDLQLRTLPMHHG